MQVAWLANLRAVVRDAGSGLGKRLKLDNTRRRDVGKRKIEQTLDVFYTLREGGRALRRTWGRTTRILEESKAVQLRLDRRGRRGQYCQGHGTTMWGLWRAAERLWDQTTAAEAAWNRSSLAFEFFTPQGRLNDRGRAKTVVAAVLPDPCGVAWTKTSRLPVRRQIFKSLNQLRAW